MQIHPIKDRPELTEAIRKAVEWFNSLTPEQQKAHRDAQRDSWVRAEMSWPRDCPYR